MNQSFTLTSEQRDRLLQQIGGLMKEKVVLQQAIREQQQQTAASSEELFLELLEVLDS